MTSRIRLLLLVSAAALSGCAESDMVEYARYDLDDVPDLKKMSKDERQAIEARRPQIAAAVNALFGEKPNKIKVPEGAPLPHGGIHLGDKVVFKDKDGQARRHALKYRRDAAEPWTTQVGGYALYRRHCMHCHGAGGDGHGPTSEFLFPRPRDYRMGLFKFTSTEYGTKPTRDDLRRTITNGLAPSSMPAFEGVLLDDEIEELVDYVIFLSLRGETELALMREVSNVDPEDKDAISVDLAKELAGPIFESWNLASSRIVNPAAPRVEPTRESILRGRTLFLGQTAENLQCTGCHGPRGKGDGPSFVDQKVFYDIVFRGKSVDDLDEATRRKYEQESMDDWGKPLRPADLNKGMYKGGRRPVDIYRRIGKGINGSKMPGHLSNFKEDAPEHIWDIVNFVLALPYEPELLKYARPGPIAPTTTAASSASATPTAVAGN